MSSQGQRAKHKKRFLHFLTEFLCPLVNGGDIHISLPINQEEITFFLSESVPDEARIFLSNLEEVREERCAAWSRQPMGLLVLPDDQATMYLAAAVYNLLFLSHPIVERWSITSAAIRDITNFSLELLEFVPIASTPREALAYHTVLYGLYHLYRTDIEVKWWVGKEEFFGTEPPKRLLYWQTVRRVKQESRKTPWLSLQFSEQHISLWKAILWRSPLTELCLETRQTPLRLSPGITALKDPDLWRRICTEFLERGLVTSGYELASAFWRAASFPPLSAVPIDLPPPQSKEVLRCAAQFFYHLVSLGLFLQGQSLFDLLAGEAETDAGEGAREIVCTYSVLYQFDKLFQELYIPLDLCGTGEKHFDTLIKKTLELGNRFLERAEQRRRVMHLRTVFSDSQALPMLAQG